jgi:hypothetical protein
MEFDRLTPVQVAAATSDHDPFMAQADAVGARGIQNGTAEAAEAARRKSTRGNRAVKQTCLRSVGPRRGPAG